MFNLPDLTPLFYLAIVGLVAIALVLLIGVPWLLYFLWTHLSWVTP